MYAIYLQAIYFLILDLNAPSLEVKPLEFGFIQVKKIGHQSLGLTRGQHKFDNANLHIVIHGNAMTAQRQSINLGAKLTAKSEQIVCF